MDEATPRIRQAQARRQGFPVGAVMTEAKRLARKAIKAQWQAQGRKVPHVPYVELVEAARDYLHAHRAELVNQARANLRNYVQRSKR
jgi:hypothetical protein